MLDGQSGTCAPLLRNRAASLFPRPQLQGEATYKGRP